MWHYLYFIVLVKVKDPTEFTGPESYVYSMVKVRRYEQSSLILRRFAKTMIEVESMFFSTFVISLITRQDKNLDWFPRMRAMSLAADDSDNEQNEIRNLQQNIEGATKLIQTLSAQLAELKEQVRLSISVLDVQFYNKL